MLQWTNTWQRRKYSFWLLLCTIVRHGREAIAVEHKAKFPQCHGPGSREVTGIKARLWPSRSSPSHLLLPDRPNFPKFPTLPPNEHTTKWAPSVHLENTMSPPHMQGILLAKDLTVQLLKSGSNPLTSYNVLGPVTTKTSSTAIHSMLSCVSLATLLTTFKIQPGSMSLIKSFHYLPPGCWGWGAECSPGFLLHLPHTPFDPPLSSPIEVNFISSSENQASYSLGCSCFSWTEMSPRPSSLQFST